MFVKSLPNPAWLFLGNVVSHMVPDALFSDPFSQKGASVQCSDQIAVSGDTPVPSMGWGFFCFNDRLLVAWFG